MRTNRRALVYFAVLNPNGDATITYGMQAMIPERVDSVRDSGENPAVEKPAQAIGRVAHPLGVEPKTF